MQNIFFDIGIMIIIATVGGYLAKILKQPLIPAYILTGFLIGPVGMGWITDANTIKTLAEIGIAFLLFVVGMELDLKRLRDIGKIASIGATVQILSLFFFGFILAHFMGFQLKEAVYIGVILSFSSTMVVVKLLSDKRELDTLHGRIIIGILLMEDIFAILALSALSSTEFSAGFVAISILKGISILALAVFSSKFIFPSLFKYAARSQEILFLLGITVCFSFSMIAHFLGFSIIMGAFVAGVAIGNLPYHIEIIGKIKPLRDFFGTLFFVSLGMELVLGSISRLITPLIIFVIFIVLFKPLLITTITGLFNYTRRTSFLTSISLAQTSEFSLIIVSQALLLGHISEDIFTFAILLAIITITLTSYLIKHENSLYSLLGPHLRIFESTKAKKDMEYLPEKKDYDIVLVGYNRIGYSIVNTVKRIKKSLLVVDFNPDIIRMMKKGKVACFYGDIGDIEVLDRVNFKKAQIVISTVPDLQDSMLLIKKVKEVNEKIPIFVTASHVDDALTLYDMGADYVIMPHFLGGDHVSLILEDITSDINKMITTKLIHIKELKNRKEIGHEHPPHHRHR